MTSAVAPCSRRITGSSGFAHQWRPSRSSTAHAPRGIVHHFVQLAAATGLGGAGASITECRSKASVPPPPPPPGRSRAVAHSWSRSGVTSRRQSTPCLAAGGCVCLETGVHNIPRTLFILRSNVKRVGESPGPSYVRVRSEAALVLWAQISRSKVLR